ncbi:MAG: (Fe-S)-binding protein [Caldimicrobium sp.]
MKEKNFFLSLNKEALSERIKLEPAYCHLAKGCYLAKISFSENLSSLLPYLKPQVKALYYEPENLLIFKWGRGDKFYKVSLKGDTLKFGTVSDREEAREVFFELFDYLKELSLKFDNIEPDYKPVKRPQALVIYKYLPKTNCKECGEMTCLALAAKISMGEAEPENCPHLTEESLNELRSLLE